jgi:2-dehydro-3-deoxy-L-rhamnonate dehydrogenase (NAD+)
VAVVTGAARGIGFATAALLAERGAAVALADLDEDRLRSANSALEGSGFSSIGLTVDVSDAAAVEESVRAVVARWGRIDVLVNSAGVAGRSVPTWELDGDDWSTTIGINLSGTFFPIRAVLPEMLARNYGRIVNVSSIAGKEGNPNAVPYSASKAGVIGLTKAIAKEVSTNGILVNCVTPAVIETEMLEQVSQEHIDYMLTRIPMRRAGRPEEVAELICWLASDRCSFSTGAVFDVSGGRATY